MKIINSSSAKLGLIKVCKHDFFAHLNVKHRYLYFNTSLETKIMLSNIYDYQAIRN